MVKIHHTNQTVEITECIINSPIIYNYFSKIPASSYEDNFKKALYIGVLALMEDRFSAFLSKTQNELGTELESLKMIFDMKMEVFAKSTLKGTIAEEEIADFLISYCKQKGFKDDITLTGNTEGVLKKNKTGDILSKIEGRDDLKIVIECKFDKSIKLGDIADKDIFTKKSDTAWSQLLESKVNRDGKISLIVFERSLADNSILSVCDNVLYLPHVGFIVIVDSQNNDYRNLAVAYTLARDITTNMRDSKYDLKMLYVIVNRIINTITEIFKIRELVEDNIDNNIAILNSLEKSMLMMEFNMDYLKKFLVDGLLSPADLLDFYSGSDVKEKYLPIEKSINDDLKKAKAKENTSKKKPGIKNKK